MNAVLMDTRRHRTVIVTIGRGATIVVLVQDVDYSITEVTFRRTGDTLCGDPIYLQVKGPELPDDWWDGKQ